jgi:hypothetical protein
MGIYREVVLKRGKEMAGKMTGKKMTRKKT